MRYSLLMSVGRPLFSRADVDLHTTLMCLSCSSWTVMHTLTKCASTQCSGIKRDATITDIVVGCMRELVFPCGTTLRLIAA